MPPGFRPGGRRCARSSALRPGCRFAQLIGFRPPMVGHRTSALAAHRWPGRPPRGKQCHKAGAFPEKGGVQAGGKPPGRSPAANGQAFTATGSGACSGTAT